ncbi:HlyIII-domain-containing protein [Atractiella rhizophila]|nr:HlyIII-domain-containing protein [Atractiella rhizophila]
MKAELLTYKQLSNWRKDNPSILSGYRPEYNNVLKCLKSMFMFHNETVNIQTHFIGAAVSLYLLVYFVSARHPPVPHTTDHRMGIYAPFYSVHPVPSSLNAHSVSWRDTGVFAIFLTGASVCLGLSSAFHTLCCHSKEVAARMNRLDYIGIAVLIVASFYPAVYYGFFCDPTLQIFYLTCVTVAGLASTYVVISPIYALPEYRRTRTRVFIALGLSAVFPVFHSIYKYGLHTTNDHFSLPWLVSSGVLYIVGALLYAERCPEIFSPGTFDLIGASHQIFHICICAAVVAHLGAIADAFRFRHGEMKGYCLA